MDNNTNNKHAAGGPPMTFAMPMYHDFVPKWIRPWIYVVLAFCFQLFLRRVFAPFKLNDPCCLIKQLTPLFRFTV